MRPAFGQGNRSNELPCALLRCVRKVLCPWYVSSCITSQWSLQDGRCGCEKCRIPLYCREKCLTALYFQQKKWRTCQHVIPPALTPASWPCRASKNEAMVKEGVKDGPHANILTNWKRPGIRPALQDPRSAIPSQPLCDNRSTKVPTRC